MQCNRLVFLLFTGVLLSACSSTLVVLVPDPSGKVGEVVVATKGGETVLNKADESTEVSGEDSAPSEAKLLSRNTIDETFAEALQNEPRPPMHYIFYFEFDSASMAADAKNQIPNIHDDLNNRTVCEVSVIGHSDRAGDENYNRTLSLNRADAVARLLTETGVPKECMDIRYYGESDPLVPTADGVPEPRNRRVEVEVR